MQFHAELVGESSDKIWKHAELESLLQSKSKEVHSQFGWIFSGEGWDTILQCNRYEQRNLLSQISPGVGLSHHPRGMGTASRSH